ncbi:type VII secretion target [Umezawaea sp. Da 62-37]|uniref:WXG100 family type VII secretion target n=1 Tax=Umezawaea sp. Da 62-37 TaxID=3075927 RepID=UPI0028F728CB|nr:type VII secretion target [Umezawaea sp. Da 62-37]WNV91123.1 type VII secretion target [Umezawaea sp. Da 62-37]
MTGFEVDPTALRSASPKFSSTGDKLADTWEALRSVMDAEGTCWGTDEVGQKFAEGYTPAADTARESFPGIAGAIQNIRTELDDTATTWERSDQGNARSFGAQG